MTEAAKAVTLPLGAMADCDLAAARRAWTEVLADGTEIRLAAPFERFGGASDLFDGAIAPLYAAMPDLERRETIRMAGTDGHGDTWVGIAGAWVGTFSAPFLHIPPTRRPAAMRFHEFFRIEDGRAVEMQVLWDIPELMMQAGVWPMAPSLGRDWQVPGPMTQDGLRIAGNGAAARAVVMDMLAHLGKSGEGPDAMRLDTFWHPRAAWYGPAGIGSTRGIAGFRRHHQIPFLGAMPDRTARVEAGHLIAEGAYVGFTAWPGIDMTLTGGGWLGLPGTGQRLTMRSLDFWRVEGKLIRENWVLVDLLDICGQLGVDVLARMRELAE